MECTHYKVKEIHDWEGLLTFYNGTFNTLTEQWIFRGQADASRPLRTTLERDIGRFWINKNIKEDSNEYDRELSEVLGAGIKNNDGKKQSIFELEGGLLREFKRKCHHYEMQTPDPDDIAEWFALMRHYGAPSRFLDWTYSFFVAVFFALEEAKKECAVWALETKWIHELVIKNFKDFKKTGSRGRGLAKDLEEVDKIAEPKTFKKLFIKLFIRTPKKAIPFAYPWNPFRLNQRLVVQQGLFLSPRDVSKTLEENLIAILPEGNGHKKFYKCKITVDLNERKNILLHLHRMNISRATLFPGLQGFAESLKTLLAFPDLLKAEKSWGK